MDDRSRHEAAARFARLLERLRAGDEQAAADVVGRLQFELLVHAEARGADRLRAQYDPEGVVQSVFRSFFRRLRGGQYLELAGWTQLRGLLHCLTRNKAVNQVNRLQADRRGGTQTVVSLRHEPAGLGPGPLDCLIVREMLERVHGRLPERERPVLELLLYGEEVKTIAQRTGYGRRSVERIRVRLHDLIQRELYGSRES